MACVVTGRTSPCGSSSLRTRGRDDLTPRERAGCQFVLSQSEPHVDSSSMIQHNGRGGYRRFMIPRRCQWQSANSSSLCWRRWFWLRAPVSPLRLLPLLPHCDLHEAAAVTGCAMGRRTPLARVPLPDGSPQPPHRTPRHFDVMLLLQLLREVHVIVVLIYCTRQ